MGYKPQLSHAARPATYTVEAVDESGTPQPTPIAGEHPLTLYVDKQEILTMMTLGAAPEALLGDEDQALVAPLPRVEVADRLAFEVHRMLLAGRLAGQRGQPCQVRQEV